MFHIYFVDITAISRDSNDNIIDISSSYVSGTPYSISEDLSTDTHIAPNEIAPFEILTSVDKKDVSRFEYIIHYRIGEESTTLVTEQPAMLLSNVSLSKTSPLISFRFL